MWGIQSFEHFDLVVDGRASIDHFSPNVLQVLSKSDELFLDLVRKFSGVAEDDSLAGLGLVWELVEDGEYEHCGLAHARLGLRQDIDSYHCVRNALLLHLRGMLEPAFLDSSEQFRLQQQVFEACDVNASS